MKCVVLGAGATAFCSIANPIRRPPMLNKGDLFRMIDRPVVGILNSPYGEKCLVPLLRDLFHAYDGQIEEICTDLVRLENLPWQEDNESLQAAAVAAFGASCRELGLVNLLTTRQGFRGSLRVRNLVTELAGAFRDEIHACLGTTTDPPEYLQTFPICPDHRVIARNLVKGDIVVTFNYDEIMPYALLNEYRLERSSIQNPLIKYVLLPPGQPSLQPVTLVTPHGSWTWRLKVDGARILYHDILVDLDGGASKQVPDGYGMLPNPVLPYREKIKTVKAFPAYYLEAELALQSMNQADELHLVGKQFWTGDRDWVSQIARACSSKAKTRLVLANPAVQDQAWVDHHRDMFNASRAATITLNGFAEYVAWLEQGDLT